VLLGAGLPILPGLAGESKSYAERLFSFPDIGALSEDDAAKALRDPAQAMGVVFDTGCTGSGAGNDLAVAGEPCLTLW